MKGVTTMKYDVNDLVKIASSLEDISIINRLHNRLLNSEEREIILMAYAESEFDLQACSIPYKGYYIKGLKERNGKDYLMKDEKFIMMDIADEEKGEVDDLMLVAYLDSENDNTLMITMFD